MSNKRVLVLGAHTDDVELMCGGTIVKLIELGFEIYYITFSFAVESLPQGFSPGVTRIEVNKAARTLGIKLPNIMNLSYEVRMFPKYRQDILEKLIDIKKLFKPSLVITHNSKDIHQDHKTLSEETYRAFKETSTIWGYESFKNNRGFNNDLYIKLNKEHIDKKIEATSKYESQIVKYDYREALLGLAKFRGAQISYDYAECFEILRAIL